MNKKGLLKSVGLTVLGLALFLVKLPAWNQSVFNRLVDLLEGLLDPLNSWLLLVFLSFAFLGTLGGTVFQWRWICNHPRLKRAFVGKKMQLLTLAISLFVVISQMFLPISFLNQESADLIPSCAHMLIFMTSAKLILPLVSDYGLAEFLEVYLRPVMKPLLKVPGSAVIHMLTSMLVSVNMAVVTVIEQYRESVYNRREAVIIISCMMIPPMTFVMMAMSTVGQPGQFNRFYLYLLLTAVLVSIITVRLLPIARIPESYIGAHEEIVAEGSGGQSRWQRALTSASQKAESTHYHPGEQLVSIALNMIGFIPYILAWGTVMKVILAYTSIVQWITWPYALWLSLFQVPEAALYSPMAVMNFIDVVLPVVMLKNVADGPLVLRLLCMTLGEIVYLAPFLLAIACKELTNLRELLGIWLVRLILLVPAASLLFHVFF